jgi:CelD/BcsL family acetyltransferase involved in cellulose biosynthesis
MMHSWFNAYDRDFAGYSTGILLQMKTLQAAAEHGITFLDMGKGPEEYKKQLATGALRVAEGVIDPVAMRARARSAWWAVRSGIQASPLHRLLKKPVQKAFQLHGWLQLR